MMEEMRACTRAEGASLIFDITHKSNRDMQLNAIPEEQVGPIH